MTPEQVDEYLFFLRDEMLRNFSYDASLVWCIPSIAIEDPGMSRLVYRWFYTTDPVSRKHFEGQMLSRISERYGAR